MPLMVALLFGFIVSSRCVGANAADLTPRVSLFVKVPVHGLAFGEAGDLYVSKERSIMRVSPDGNISQLTELPISGPEKPRIWNMAWHQGALYCAAHDRIVRVASDGKVTNLVEESFGGPCGVTDLVFDKKGKLFVAYDNIIACYTADWKKSIVFDGKNASTKARWITSLRIDAKGRFWFSDVAKKHVFLAEPNKDGMLTVLRVFDLPECPEYLAIADDGRVYVGFPDADSIALLSDDGSQKLHKLSGQLKFPVGMAFGGPGFERDALYIAGRNGVSIVRFVPQPKAP